jgi:membrane protease YdiL (CAAX protease family)
MPRTSGEGLRRLQLPLFFALTFVLSWMIWVPEAAGALGVAGLDLSPESPLNLFAVWGPALSAMILSALLAGRAGLRRLLGPLGRWRVGAWWYGFALLFPAGVWVLAALADRLLGQTYELSPPFSQLGPQYAAMVPFFALFAFPSALGEEIGWRGFALPRLQARYNALVSSLILGSVWALWHVPHDVGQSLLGAPLLAALIYVFSSSILFSWVYNSTEGSLLLVWLFHGAQTITGYLLPPLPTFTDELLLWFLAALVAVIAGPAHLSRRPRVSV